MLAIKVAQRNTLGTCLYRRRQEWLRKYTLPATSDAMLSDDSPEKSAKFDGHARCWRLKCPRRRLSSQRSNRRPPQVGTVGRLRRVFIQMMADEGPEPELSKTSCAKFATRAALAGRGLHRGKAAAYQRCISNPSIL